MTASFCFNFNFESRPGLWLHIFVRASVARGSDDLKQMTLILLLFSACWRLCLHHFIFLCSHMWLMVILCMVAGFLLCCTWLPLCQNIRSKTGSVLHVVYLVSLFLFVFADDRERDADSWITVSILAFIQEQWRKCLSPHIHTHTHSHKLSHMCCLY